MDKEQKHRLILILEEHMFRVEDLCISEELSTAIKVHEIRKSFKRMNALFRLFPESLAEEVKAFLKDMKASARQLTMARETTVNLQFYEAMCAEHQCLAVSGAKELHQQLDQENQLSLESLVKHSLFDSIKELMVKGRHGFLEALPDNDFTINISEELELSFMKARELIVQSNATYHPEEYHELRKKMKILWYQFEFIHPGQTDVPGTLSEKLHNITDQLGDDHDWYIFLEEIEDDKYFVTFELKSLLENTIQQYQKANLDILNQNLSEFFREKNNEFRKAISNL